MHLPPYCVQKALRYLVCFPNFCPLNFVNKCLIFIIKHISSKFQHYWTLEQFLNLSRAEQDVCKQLAYLQTVAKFDLNPLQTVGKNSYYCLGVAQNLALQISSFHEKLRKFQIIFEMSEKFLSDLRSLKPKFSVTQTNNSVTQ